MEKDEFFLKVAHALSGCQLVEQQLKLYITEALALVEKCVEGKMIFRMSGEDYEDSSLERLVETFKKLSNNEQLITDLNKFKAERNFLTHKGISHCLDWDEEMFLSAVTSYELRLVNIQKEANRLREAIHLESHKFIGHLYFDAVEKPG
jgi:hypothetical protein